MISFRVEILASCFWLVDVPTIIGVRGWSVCFAIMLPLCILVSCILRDLHLDEYICLPSYFMWHNNVLGVIAIILEASLCQLIIKLQNMIVSAINCNAWLSVAWLYCIRHLWYSNRIVKCLLSWIRVHHFLVCFDNFQRISFIWRS